MNQTPIQQFEFTAFMAKFKADIDKRVAEVEDKAKAAEAKAEAAEAKAEAAAMIGLGNHTNGITTAAQYYDREEKERRFTRARSLFELYSATPDEIDDVLTKLAAILGKRIDCDQWFQEQSENV